MYKQVIYVAIHTSPIFDESLAIQCIEYGDLIKTYNCSISAKPSNYQTLQKEPLLPQFLTHTQPQGSVLGLWSTLLSLINFTHFLIVPLQEQGKNLIA